MAYIYNGELEECDIIKMIDKERSVCLVKCRKTGKKYYTQTSMVFDTEEDALAYFRQEHDDRTSRLKKKIKTVADLVCFPMKYPVSYNGEHTDYDAREAYMERAKELLEIDFV